MNRRIQMFLGAAVVAVCVFSVGTEARAVAPKVLGTFTDGPYTWLLSVDSCAAAPEGYPLFVTLLENARPKGSVTLPMPAAVRDFAREPADQPWAVSALDAEPSLSAWGSGEEESYLGVVARLVPLGEKKQGLLVSEVGGFSHLHRAHALYAVVDGSLKELWSFDEGARPRPPRSVRLWSAKNPLCCFSGIFGVMMRMRPMSAKFSCSACGRMRRRSRSYGCPPRRYLYIW